MTCRRFKLISNLSLQDTYLSSEEHTACVPTQSSYQYTFTVDHLKHHTEILQCLVKNEANTNGVASQIVLSVDGEFVL